VTDGARRRRGLVLSAVAALVVTAAYVVLRQRHAPDLIVRSDEGWQPDVHVAIGGEVTNPGAYALRGDARLSDLVSAAGGYTDRAERSALNPAARVGDGMEYVIPVQSARSATATAKPATVVASTSSPTATATAAAIEPRPTARVAVSPPATSAAGRINLNTATREELEALPAIGPVFAQRIIDDRTANGPYKQIEDLARVRGISSRTVDQLRDRITVGP